MLKYSSITYSTPVVPRQVRLDTVNYCQARCIFCHLLQSNRPKNRMDMGMVEQILNEIATWPQPPNELVSVNYGECFLHPYWFDILKLIEYKLPYTRIVVPTNGALLDYENLRKLLSIRTISHINFSINAAFEESYTEIMGLPASNMMKVRNLAARIRQDRPQIQVWASAVVNSLWMSDLERDKFIEQWRDVAVPQINSAAFCNGREKPWRALKEPCRTIFSDMVVGGDGKIGSCCYDPNLVIDLGCYPQDGTLLELWQGEKFRRLRQVHNEGKRGDYAPCGGCTFA